MVYRILPQDHHKEMDLTQNRGSMTLHNLTTIEFLLTYNVEGPTLQMSSQLASLNFLQGLRWLDCTFIDPVWKNYDKLFIIFDKLLAKIVTYLHEVG